MNRLIQLPFSSRIAGTHKMFGLSCLVPLLLLLSTTGKGESGPDSTLTILADTPAAAIQASKANKKFVELPTLEFAFEIHASCLHNRKPTSLLLSVADTRKTLDADDFASGSPVTMTLRIPAAQMGPIAVEDFCHIDSDTNTTQQLTISAALSAHASLRCEGETDQKVLYVSEPLDVALTCEQPVQAQADDLSIDLD